MKRRTIVGILLIVAGAWKLANMWGVIENDWLWSQAWTVYIGPIAIIYLGMLMILTSYRRNREQWLRRPLPIGEDGKRICCNVHYGGDEYVYHGEVFHGASLDVFCGGIRMDLREATITEDEEIDIHTFFGGVELIVPTDVNIIVKSRSIIGGVGDETKNRNQEGVHRLYITASNMMGGVSIKNEI